MSLESDEFWLLATTYEARFYAEIATMKRASFQHLLVEHFPDQFGWGSWLDFARKFLSELTILGYKAGDPNL